MTRSGQGAARRAVFRVDAGRAVGFGHLRRCLALAEALRGEGWHCGFAIGDDGASAAFALGDTPHSVVCLEGENGLRPEALFQHFPDGCGLCVIDHYAIDCRYEATLREWADHVLVIDDLADRPHECGFLLNQNYGVPPAIYHDLIPDHCSTMLGSAYALLPGRFRRLRADALRRRREEAPAGRVLVSFGGVDSRNLTQRTIEALERLALDVTVEVVLTAAAPHLEAVRARARSVSHPVRILTDVTDMAGLMAAADLAVGGLGATAWERCCLGLPAVAVTVVGNQQAVARGIGERGAAHLLGAADTVTADHIAAAVGSLVADREALVAMSRNAAALCDGLGARRAALTLAPPMVAGAGALALRPLRPDDEVCVLAWQQTPETRRYFRNPSPPTPAEHNAWMDARLSRKPNLTFVITVDGRAAGLLHLDPAPAAGTAPETFEVSILIAPEWHRRGIGKAALRLLHHTFTGAGFVAAVHPANEPSHRLFRSAGYRRQGDVYVYDAGPPTGTDRERFDDRHTSSRQTQGVSPSCSRP